MKTRIPTAAEPRLSADEWILGIADAGEIEPVGRADRPAGRAIAGVEGGFDDLRRPSPCANPFERADKAAHLIVQERPRAQVKAELGAIGAGDFFDAKRVERFDGAMRLTDRRAEGGEIMLADQMGRGLAHAVDVQRLLDLPDQPRLMCRRRTTYQHTKQIPAFKRGKIGRAHV